MMMKFAPSCTGVHETGHGDQWQDISFGSSSNVSYPTLILTTSICFITLILLIVVITLYKRIFLVAQNLNGII